MTEVYIYRPPHKTYHALAGCDRGRSPASTPGVWKISCRVPDITPLLGHACIVDTNPKGQLCLRQGRLTSVDTLLRRRQRKKNGRRIQWRCAPAPDPISGRLRSARANMLPTQILISTLRFADTCTGADSKWPFKRSRAIWIGKKPWERSVNQGEMNYVWGSGARVWTVDTDLVVFFSSRLFQIHRAASRAQPLYRRTTRPTSTPGPASCRLSICFSFRTVLRRLRAAYILQHLPSLTFGALSSLPSSSVHSTFHISHINLCQSLLISVSLYQISAHTIFG